MSGGYGANAGGIFVSGYTAPAGGTNDEVDRHIHLMIYQLASYLNAQDHRANIQNAAQQALGGMPNASEIQATTVNVGTPISSLATDISVNNGTDHALTVGISSDVTYYPQNDPNLYYVLDLQDLSIILTVLQLNNDVNNQSTSQGIFNAAFPALKAISGQLEERVEQQGWQGRAS